MNIFVLHADPQDAAIALCDKHVVKMIVESAQILSTAVQLHGGPSILRLTHSAHPCVQWAAASTSNFGWLLDHFKAMMCEYTGRYGKRHKYDLLGLADHFDTLSAFIPIGTLQPFAQCMPEVYRGDDAVEAYRRYYKAEKAYFCKWKLGNVPTWWAA